jgi:hypothetical protein
MRHHEYVANTALRPPCLCGHKTEVRLCHNLKPTFLPFEATFRSPRAPSPSVHADFKECPLPSVLSQQRPSRVRLYFRTSRLPSEKIPFQSISYIRPLPWLSAPTNFQHAPIKSPSLGGCRPASGAHERRRAHKLQRCTRSIRMGLRACVACECSATSPA